MPKWDGMNAMLATAAPAEDRVLLRNISWETYKRLLAEVVNVTSRRFFYNEGNLEIMVVYIGHERPNRTLERIAQITAEETGRDFSAAGSTTYKRDDLEKGFEPDSSFYFRHAAEVRDKDELDLATDPPPELIIEVDITSSSLDHFPLYAAIGISEIWRYSGKRVSFHKLEGSAYSVIDESIVLPRMTAAQATIFVERDRHEKAADWLRAVRQWIRASL
jgi:Uma2 family endonuclease